MFEDDPDGTSQKAKSSDTNYDRQRRSDPCSLLCRVLQYAETPQYMRKALFPRHPDLRLVGLLNPLDAPHHLRADHECSYREGVVVNKPVKMNKKTGKAEGSLVDVGLRSSVYISQSLRPGVRVTVNLKRGKGGKLMGTAVPPAEPREKGILGGYWGYDVRYAPSLRHVWSGCPFKVGRWMLGGCNRVLGCGSAFAVLSSALCVVANLQYPRHLTWCPTLSPPNPTPFPPNPLPQPLPTHPPTPPHRTGRLRPHHRHVRTWHNVRRRRGL